MLFKSLNPFVAVILYTLILTSGLLFPFDFSYPISNVKTNVQWLSDTNGIEISSNSAICSIIAPLRLYDALVTGDGLTIDIWLNTKNNMQRGPARIVSYSLNKYLRNFTLGQDGKDLIFRLRTIKTDLNGKPELIAKNIFKTRSPLHIVITYDFSHETVYVNGKKRIRGKYHTGNLSNWDPSYLLVLGNEATGNRPWAGKIYKVAIYNRTLSHQEVLQNYKFGIVNTPNQEKIDHYISDGLVVFYFFDEGSGDVVTDQSGLRPPIDLHIPQKLQVTNKIFLLSPYENFTLNIKNLKDIILNILGFIPLGFLLHAIMRRWYGLSIKIVIFAFLLGSLFSFSIESLQYLALTRISSMVDIFFNMIGMTVGIIVDKYTYFSIHMKRTSSC